MEKDEQAHASNKKMNFKYLVVFILFFSIVLNFGCSYISKSLNYQDSLTAEEHNNLGVAYEKEEKYKLAINEYKKALNKDKDLVTSLINIGNVYFKQGKYKKAKKYYKKALKKDEQNILASNNLGNVYLKTEKDYEKGIKYLSIALSSPEDAPPYSLDTFAMLYARVGNKEKALELLSLACKKLEKDEILKAEINDHLKELDAIGCEN